VVCDREHVLCESVTDTGARPQANAESAFARALEQVGARSAEVQSVTVTGYGRHRFSRADQAVSEIACHAVGVNCLFPHARTVIDVGGQDSKAIWVSSEGRVIDFAMNDRCAAGTGRFLELAAHTMGVTVQQIGPLATLSRSPSPISSMCAVFAETEIVGLLQSGAAPEDVLLGLCRSVALRLTSLLGSRGVEGSLVFTGGVANNQGVALELQRCTHSPVLVAPNPQTTGALGAALLAARADRPAQRLAPQTRLPLCPTHGGAGVA
jgi:(R)-2-hydroxyacyl-CoA dehydratese activating ATPase